VFFELLDNLATGVENLPAPAGEAGAEDPPVALIGPAVVGCEPES
jgi:hypothetical protein